MTHLHVKIDRNCTHSHYQNGDYGAWTETWSNCLEGVYLQDSGSYYPEKVPIDFEAQQGDIVYVVWAEYSSGNSFGRGYRKYTDIVHIFKSKDLAWEAYRALKDVPTDDYGLDCDCEQACVFNSDQGTEITYHKPWLGYFDELNAIRVEEAIVE